MYIMSYQCLCTKARYVHYQRKKEKTPNPNIEN